VLHVIPTQTMRGAQREARALADRLDVPGVRRHRVLNLFAGPAEVRADESLEHPGGEIAARGFDARLVLRLRSALSRLRPSVVVAHGGDPLKYMVPAAPIRLPLVYYATGTFGGAAKPSKVLLWRMLVRRASVVACEGEEVLDECRGLLRVPPRRLALAPNGRDPDRFHPPSPEEYERRASSGESPVVAFVGALNKGKGADLFVELVRSLRLRGIPFRAWMCGNGPMYDELEARSSDAGIEALGARQDVDVLMRSADVFVFPSRPAGEGMPGVLIEAGLSGLPVVAADVPGVRTILEDSVTGFVVPIGDVAAMQSATAKLLAEPRLRVAMGAAARERCVGQFTIDRVARTWLSFLEPLLPLDPVWPPRSG
jgi:glycosyltransferase involved in cell wall biosynthesis